MQGTVFEPVGGTALIDNRSGTQSRINKYDRAGC